MTLSCGSGS
ncbi:hypothetical protein YPPY45_1461, partial [Yersinia pestis PY-45]